MPRHDGELVGAEASLLEEEIRAAHTARVDPDPRLARARHRVLTLDELERGADGGKQRDAHQATPNEMPANRAQAAAEAAREPRLADE